MTSPRSPLPRPATCWRSQSQSQRQTTSSTRTFPSSRMLTVASPAYARSRIPFPRRSRSTSTFSTPRPASRAPCSRVPCSRLFVRLQMSLLRLLLTPPPSQTPFPHRALLKLHLLACRWVLLWIAIGLYELTITPHSQCTASLLHQPLKLRTNSVFPDLSRYFFSLVSCVSLGFLNLVTLAMGQLP